MHKLLLTLLRVQLAEHSAALKDKISPDYLQYREWPKINVWDRLSNYVVATTSIFEFLYPELRVQRHSTILTLILQRRLVYWCMCHSMKVSDFYRIVHFLQQFVCKIKGKEESDNIVVR